MSVLVDFLLVAVPIQNGVLSSFDAADLAGLVGIFKEALTL